MLDWEYLNQLLLENPEEYYRQMEIFREMSVPQVDEDGNVWQEDFF